MINQNPHITLPKWISNKALLVYFLALLVVSAIYNAYLLPWYYMLSGILSIFVFFYFGNSLTSKRSALKCPSSKRFEKHIFWVAFVWRFIWMTIIYAVFMQYYGDALGFDNLDSAAYNWLAEIVADSLREGNIHVYDEIIKNDPKIDISDVGYAIYVGFVYYLSGSSIFVVRLLKCAISAFTCVLVYRLAVRNFGEDVGRVAAIFCALWPNFCYYCGTLLKETEMVFLSVLFVEQADQMLRTRNFSAWKVVPILLISGALFTIRTPLAIVSILCLLFSIFMSSTRIVSWGKRIAIGVLAVGLIGVTMGNRIQEEANGLMAKVSSGEQQKNMEWRAVRVDAAGHQNKFAKYAGAAVFAPLIFSIPFPTMVSPYDGQYVQKLLHGGNFIKNILSGFTILALFAMLFSGQWRDHLLPLSFMLGYVVVLVMSVFAQSERFHQPAMPFEFMFAAYGLSIVLQGIPLKIGIGNRATYKRWFTYWCVFTFFAALVWSWFKLAGRGLV